VVRQVLYDEEYQTNVSHLRLASHSVQIPPLSPFMWISWRVVRRWINGSNESMSGHSNWAHESSRRPEERLQSNETPVQPPVQRSWTDLPKRQALPFVRSRREDPRSCKALLTTSCRSESTEGEVIDCWTCIFAHPRFGKSSEPMSAWALQRSRHVVLLEGRRAAKYALSLPTSSSTTHRGAAAEVSRTGGPLAVAVSAASRVKI